MKKKHATSRHRRQHVDCRQVAETCNFLSQEHATCRRRQVPNMCNKLPVWTGPNADRICRTPLPGGGIAIRRVCLFVRGNVRQNPATSCKGRGDGREGGKVNNGITIKTMPELSPRARNHKLEAPKINKCRRLSLISVPKIVVIRQFFELSWNVKQQVFETQWQAVCVCVNIYNKRNTSSKQRLFSNNVLTPPIDRGECMKEIASNTGIGIAIYKVPDCCTCVITKHDDTLLFTPFVNAL